MERTARIELAALAWKAKVLPLYDARFSIFVVVKVVEGGGFEPPKAEPSDLQSDPFGTREPLQYFYNNFINGADCRSRTGDLLITSQLLYQLS